MGSSHYKRMRERGEAMDRLVEAVKEIAYLLRPCDCCRGQRIGDDGYILKDADPDCPNCDGSGLVLVNPKLAAALREVERGGGE